MSNFDSYYEQPTVHETEVEFDCKHCEKTVVGTAFWAWADASTDVECPECGNDTTYTFPQLCGCGDDKCYC